jgi:4-oxalocrotonate tautomerase family enzyme
VEVSFVPLVEISIGEGGFTDEEKIQFTKAINASIAEFFQEVKGVKPHIWIIIREEAADNWLINGETLTEVRKKREAQK